MARYAAEPCDKGPPLGQCHGVEKALPRSWLALRRRAARALLSRKTSLPLSAAAGGPQRTAMGIDVGENKGPKLEAPPLEKNRLGSRPEFQYHITN